MEIVLSNVNLLMYYPNKPPHTDYIFNLTDSNDLLINVD